MKKFVYNFLSFIGYSLRERIVLISLLGYILVLISPMFNWYSSALTYTGVSEEYSFNMFQLSSSQINERSYIALGIFTILICIGFVAIEYLDYKIKLRERLRIIIPVEVLLYIALVVIVVAAVNNEALKEAMSYRSGEIKALEYWVKDAKGHCNHGAGPIIFIAGLSIAVLSKVGVYIYYFVDNVKDSLTTKKG